MSVVTPPAVTTTGKPARKSAVARMTCGGTDGGSRVAPIALDAQSRNSLAKSPTVDMAARTPAFVTPGWTASTRAIGAIGIFATETEGIAKKATWGRERLSSTRKTLLI